MGPVAGIPVAVGAFDAHLGGVGVGIAPGTLAKIIGTSTCDMMVSAEKPADIPGLCGIVNGSILPGFYGLEAGQSAVGDIFNWFVNYIKAGDHVELTKAAAKLKPGESGLVALDWNNGNRTILVDPRLTGLMVGQTLHTSRAEIYRALIEATAFGAKAIIDRMREHGVRIDRVVCCGGIAEKNPLLMQIYADITGCEMQVSGSSQACALGAAISAAVLAGGALAVAGVAFQSLTRNPLAEPSLLGVSGGAAFGIVAGERFEMQAGDTCFFPADTIHVFTVTSDTPVKVLVVYAPPYGESPDKVIRPPAA